MKLNNNVKNNIVSVDKNFYRGIPSFTKRCVAEFIMINEMGFPLAVKKYHAKSSGNYKR